MNEARRARLGQLIDAIRELNDFSGQDAKSVCRDCAPSYVTRTLNALARQGFLDPVAGTTKKHRRWRWNSSKLSSIETWVYQTVYGEQVKQTPENDRPREVLLRDGPTRMTLDQLLAILLRAGVPGESALQAARILANHYGLRLVDLPDASLPDLKRISRAVRKDSYCQIMAGIELGRRIACLKEESTKDQIRIRSADDAMAYCMRIFERLAYDGKQEQFHIVTLDTQYGPINHHLITQGTLDASLVHPREVFRPAIRDAASAILLVHNHPSGDPKPSQEDRNVTRRLKEAGELIGIQILDHIIVAREGARSLLQH